VGAPFRARRGTDRFILGPTLFAGVQIDPPQPLFATPPHHGLGKSPPDTAAPKRGFDIEAVNPCTSWRWIQPSRDPLDNFDGAAPARLSNPGMPSALGNGGAKVKLQGCDHPVYGQGIWGFHLLGHGAPIS